jgi:hypothetical protein
MLLLPVRMYVLVLTREKRLKNDPPARGHGALHRALPPHVGHEALALPAWGHGGQQRASPPQSAHVDRGLPARGHGSWQ